MGTFKCACKMLKREKRQAISYGITVLFTVFVSFVFFNIINNDTLMDQTAAASGGSFSQVSVPLSSIIAFVVIIFCGLMIKYYICIGINDKQLLIWKQGNTMSVQVEAVGAFGMRTETRLLASLPAR